MKLFISGWAGFREALGDIPEDWDFICPFLDFDEVEILNFLKNKSGHIIIGWSTGGHIVLKNLNFFSQRFKKIIVVAGFKEFTKYVDSRILKRMQKKMETSPDQVVREFLIKAGCSPIIPEGVCLNKFVNGLEFLQKSKICENFEAPSKLQNLTLIHGIDDEILPIKAWEDLKINYPSAKFYKIKGSHWVKFKIIRSLM